jgi:hypothetical protein
MHRIFLLASFITLVYTARAQDALPVRLSIFNESTSMPFSKGITTPIHPGVELGTEFLWKESKRLRLYPTLTAGYLFHRHLYQAVFLNGGLGLDLKFGFGLSVKGILSVGYMHTFTTQQEYQFDKGTYKSKNDKGNARVIPALAFGLGYRFNRSDFKSPEVFALYQTWIEYPYSPGFIPVMAHTNVHLGYKFYPFHPSK